MGLLAIPEAFEANPYFDRFYAMPERWAFHSFIFFYEQSIRSQASAPSAGGIVQERPPREHLLVFGAEFRHRGFLTEEDWEVLSSLARTTEPLLPSAHLLVHVDVEPPEALRRLRQRARSAETSVDLDYLEALHGRYEEFLSGWDASPVMRIDADDWDVRLDTDAQRLALEIDARLAPAAARDARLG